MERRGTNYCGICGELVKMEMSSMKEIPGRAEGTRNKCGQTECLESRHQQLTLVRLPSECIRVDRRK